MNNHYTNDLQQVIQSELDYIKERRKQNEYPAAEVEKDDLWGLCISGGGIRSATLGLGMIQAFIKRNVFRRFDYLSTVSGGGYIGACLSSLLTGDKRDSTQGGKTMGVNPGNSPFVGLGEEDTAYKPARDTKLNVMHQLHHLRTHGEYLTPQTKLTSRDVKRAVGAVTSGILHNFLLYTLFLTGVVTLTYGVLWFLSDGRFFDHISYTSYDEQLKATPPKTEETTLEYVTGVLSNWFQAGLKKQQLHLMESGLQENPVLAALFLAAGMACGIWYILSIRQAVRKIRQLLEQPGNPADETPVDDPFKAGHNPENHYESDYTNNAFSWVVIWAPALALVAGALMKFIPGSSLNSTPRAYGIIFTLPFCFALGMVLAVYLIIPFLSERASKPGEAKSGGPGQNAQMLRDQRIFRSLHGNLQGTALYGLGMAVLIPLVIVTAFSTGPSANFIFAIVSLALGYLVFKQKATGGSKVYAKVLKAVKIPLLNLSVLLFVGIGMAAIAGHLVVWHGGLAIGISAVAFAAFWVLGYFVDSNRVSPHYFYRDRISEAYLKTDARVLRKKGEDGQGLPLVNVRNDEDLLLKDLGRKNNRGPYHLIVAALNLQGSDELVRRDMKSEHFIFSRNYVGSHSTGYVKTDVYRGGYTKLARAVTISAAAVGSAAGSANAFCHSFLCTLFNLRLGYWIENPWDYRQSATGNAAPGNAARKAKRRKYFWPLYLFNELMGRCTAREKLINVSDGGHTGDNLGLLPLLQRRCKVIVVGDFEQDYNYDFQSFTHAVRMAYIEENITIDIDLKPLVPAAGAAGIGTSEKSVVTGKIRYPRTGKAGADEHQEGTLIYIKSSLSGTLPVHVFNYHKSFSDFPQQSTGDQYFDDTQFEAYRRLGEHMAAQAVALLPGTAPQPGIKPETAPTPGGVPRPWAKVGRWMAAVLPGRRDPALGKTA